MRTRYSTPLTAGKATLDVKLAHPELSSLQPSETSAPQTPS